MKLLQVQAAPGLSVPMEDKPRTYITDADAVAVPDTAYYQRRLADGDLLLQPDPAALAESAAADTDADAATAPAGKKAPKGASTNTSGA